MNIRPEFAVHKLNPIGIKKAEGIASAFSSLLDFVESMGVTGREMALVKTKLEEACWNAKRGMAVLPENQE